STYSKDDVIFLLKDISNLIEEEGNKERELKIQNGRHYSEMIPRVVLGTNHKNKRTSASLALLKYGKENFNMKKVIDKDSFIGKK
ncbi:cysteine protease StiP domain-containing protein, partial [Clostridioides difficile]